MKQNLDGKFEEVARQHVEKGILAEFWDFLRHNKKWWLLPILLTFLIFGALIFLSGTGVAPFVYTQF